MTRILRMREERGSSSDVSVIVAAPIVALLTEVRSEIATMKRWSPNSEMVSALELMCDRMDRAVREAQRTDVWLTVDKVAALSGRPPSTITRICRDHGADAGARKVKGVWSIYWPTFESFLKGAQPETDKEAA